MDINQWLISINNYSNALGPLDPIPDNTNISNALSFISTSSSSSSEEEIARSHRDRRRIIITCAIVAVVAAVIEIIPTLFAPTPPSARKRKRRFSELESDDSSPQSVNSRSSSPTSHCATSSTSDDEREERLMAIAMSSLRQSLFDLIDIMREHMRLKTECSEGQYLDAIHRMQEVDSDLSPHDQVALVDLFEKEHDTAMTYLLLESDSLRKAWIKDILTKAHSG